MSTDMTPRVPPHNNEAEIAVLGSILLDNDAFDAEGVANLKPAMFYRSGHRLLFEAMLELRQKNEPVDLVTVPSLLTPRGKLDDVGGLPYLIGLGDQVPTAAYADHYAKIVRERWVQRELISQATQLIAKAYEGQTTLEDMLTQASQIGGDLSVRSREGISTVQDVAHGVFERIRTGTALPRIKTGFTDLDKQLAGGLAQSSLTVLAARPSMGKTGLSLGISTNVALGAAEQGTVAVVSLEMPAEDLVMRMAAMEARIFGEDLMQAAAGTKPLTAGQLKRLDEAQARIYGMSMVFLDDPVQDGTLGTLLARLRRLHRQSPLSLIVIDYLQLISLSGSSSPDNRQQEVSVISRNLKLIARELGCPVLALSQLSRAVEQRANHRPMLSDLRESGAVEQDADNVMFIYRDEYYNRDTDQQGIAEIIVGKQRNGPVGTVKLQFHSAHIRFNDLTEDHV